MLKGKGGVGMDPYREERFIIVADAESRRRLVIERGSSHAEIWMAWREKNLTHEESFRWIGGGFFYVDEGERVVVVSGGCYIGLEPCRKEETFPLFRELFPDFQVSEGF